MSYPVSKIEISLDAARHILPQLEENLESLGIEIEAKRMDYDAAKVTIAELKAKINGQAVLVGIDPLRQRKRKGESERVISDLLRNLPEGSGLRMQEVCTKTGIAYSSVFRILKSKGKGKYIEDNGLWMLAKK